MEIKMLNVLLTDIKKSTDSKGKKVWTFVSQGIDYKAIHTLETDYWEVWSSKKSMVPGGEMVRVFNSLQEMKDATRALNSFASYVSTKIN
jgi:hypothetical protein